MKNRIIGCLVSLVLIVGITAGCGQQTKEEEASQILKIVGRSPALDATGISSTETLSITFNFPIDQQNITIENLFAEYLTYGSNHTAGAPDLTSASLTWSADSKTLTLSGLKGWANLTQEAGAKVVELVAKEGKIKDIFNNEIRAGDILWKFTLAEIDKTAPTALSLSINSGAAATEIKTVTIEVAASDDIGIIAYYLSEFPTTPSAGDEGWESISVTTNYSANISYNLSSGGGTKEVYVWFKDVGGNISNSVSDNIFLSYLFKIWDTTYDSGNNDSGYSIAVDAIGNVYVTGASNNGANYDFTTIKYNPNNGNQTWIATYDGGYNDSGSSIAIDTIGNVYVTGASRNGANYDFTTIKYNPNNGNQTWIATYEGGNNDLARGIAVDGSGNAYVTGYSNNGTNYDYVTIKYNANNGDQTWIATYEGGNNDYAYGIAIDESENVYVTGYSNNGTNYDYVTIKYNANNGSQTWISTYESTGNYEDYAYSIAVNESGIYVSGYTYDVTNYYYTTIKYSPNGEQAWLTISDLASSMNNEGAYDMAIDDSGNAYAGIGTDTDYAAIIKYDIDGNEIWITTSDGAGSDNAFGIATDKSGNIYLTGSSNQNYYTIKYGQN